MLYIIVLIYFFNLTFVYAQTNENAIINIFQVGSNPFTKDEYTVTKSVIRISGKVESKIEIRRVKINNINTLFDDESYDFERDITLEIGKNDILVKAYNGEGQEVAYKKFSVIYLIENNSLENAQYYALLIGISDYDNLTDLPSPIQNTKDLKEILQNKYNFSEGNIWLRENLTKTDMEEQINDFIDAINQNKPENSNVLIFFAGHGTYIKETRIGYWSPKDARIGKMNTYFSNNTLSDYLKSVRAKNVLVIADACYSGGICTERSEKKILTDGNLETFKRLHQEGSRKAMTSGNLEKVPDNSIFIEIFIQYLKNNKKDYISADALLQEIKPDIMNINPKQNPQNCPLQGNNGGDFIFQLKK